MNRRKYINVLVLAIKKLTSWFQNITMKIGFLGIPPSVQGNIKINAHPTKAKLNYFPKWPASDLASWTTSYHRHSWMQMS